MSIGEYKLTADAPAMQECVVTLKVPVTFYNASLPCDPATLQAHIDSEAHNWNEGRYPFPVEMVCEGVVRMLEVAIFSAMLERTKAIHGNAMRAVPNGYTSIAYEEAGKAASAVEFMIRGTFDCVSVAAKETP